VSDPYAPNLTGDVHAACGPHFHADVSGPGEHVEVERSVHLESPIERSVDAERLRVNFAAAGRDSHEGHHQEIQR
jgi:hypothetical protein